MSGRVPATYSVHPNGVSSFSTIRRHRMDSECERYFQLEGTPDNEKVRLARENLDERGYIWDLAFMEEKQGQAVFWLEYTYALPVRFGSPYDSPMVDLKTLSVPKVSVMVSGIETRREEKLMFNIFGLPVHGFATDFRNSEVTKNANLSCGDDGSSGVDSTGGLHKLSHATDTKEVTETVPGLVCLVPVSSFPSSSLSASTLSTVVVAFSSALLGSCPLSLSLSSSFLVVGMFRGGNNSGQHKMETRVKNMLVTLQIWVSILSFSPTQSLQHSWFRGALIRMLCGRFCSLRNRRRRRKQKLSGKLRNFRN